MVVPGDCEVSYGGATVSTLDLVDPVLDYLKDFTIEVFYLNDQLDEPKFENPFTRNLIKVSTNRINGMQTTSFNSYLFRVQVQTDTKFLKEKSTIVNGLQYLETNQDATNRDFLGSVEHYIDGVTMPASRPDYARLFFFIDGRTVKTERKYDTYIDTLQKIGSVGEILIFSAVFFIIYHHSVILELFLLNNAVLLSQFSQAGKGKIKKN